MNPSDEIKRILSEEECPICKQKFENIEAHVSIDHAGGLDVGFVKWIMRIHRDLEKIKRIEKDHGVTF